MVLENIRKIFIIRFNGVGDIIMTMPSLRALKQAYPQAQITWLVDERCKQAIEKEPLVNEVISIHRRKLQEMPKLEALKKLWGLIRWIRSQRFDLCVDLQGFSETSLLTLVSRARYRVGHRVKPGIVDRSEHQGWAYNIPVKLPARTFHRVEYFFEIVRAVGGVIRDPKLFFFVPQRKNEWARDFLLKQGVKKADILIGLNPGPGGTAKIWSAKNFASLADLLVKKMRAKVLLRGSPGDEALCEKIRSMMRTKPVMASPTDLYELGALASRCNVFVSNDTGPMHLAVAMQTPTLGLFGMSRPELSGPWGAGHQSLSVNDYRQEGDMDKITPEGAFMKIKSMLRQPRERKGH